MKTVERRPLRLVAAALLIAGLSNGGNAVTDWNAIASTTIIKNAGKPGGVASVWFAYMSLAAYDAVQSITGQYRPFYYQGTSPQSASLDAAIAAASRRILVNYFPAQQTDLDARFTSYLADLSGDAAAKAQGVSVGEAAAAAVIAARTGDGLEASVPYTPGSGPGIWNPTPPAFAAAVAPWMMQMRPFTMTTASDVQPDGPSPLTSEAWKRDYNLTRLLGGANSTFRTSSQTEIGLFWTEHPTQQYTRMFNALVDTYGLNVADSARMMAILWTGSADAAIGCWNGKFQYSFWRPVTAIQAGGGNPDLAAEPGWLPLAATPAHPEYPAAHGYVTGAVSSLIAGFFGTTRVSISADSLAFTDGVHKHSFDDTRDLMDEVFWARIYSGFHFHHSLEVGRQLGETVAREVLRNHFRSRYDVPPASSQK